MIRFFVFQSNLKRAWVRPKTQKTHSLHYGFPFAENKGFEPLVPLGTIVFKTTAIDHSANSPLQIYTRFLKLQVKNKKK